MNRTNLEKYRLVQVPLTLEERTVALRANCWFVSQVSPTSFLAVFGKKLAGAMLLSSVGPVEVLETDMTLIDFLGSVMVQYRDMGPVTDHEVDYVDSVIDKCCPIIEESYEETLTLSLQIAVVQ